MQARHINRYHLALGLLVFGLLGRCPCPRAPVLVQAAVTIADAVDLPPQTWALMGTCPDSYEPNDDFAHAWNIGWGGRVRSYICSADDVDYFQASIGTQPFKGFAIALDELPANYDLYAYDVTQQLIASSTNPGLAPESVTVQGDSVYVRVSGAEGAFDPSKPYQLDVSRTVMASETSTYTPTTTHTPIPTLTHTPTRTATSAATGTPSGTAMPSVRFFLPAIVKGYHPCCDLHEPNNDYQHAYGPLAAGNYQVCLCANDPDDWYYMVITAPTTITLDLVVPRVADYDLYLYREGEWQGPAAKSDAYGNGVTEHITYTPAQPGRYYILIRRYSGYSRCSDV